MTLLLRKNRSICTLLLTSLLTFPLWGVSAEITEEQAFINGKQAIVKKDWQAYQQYRDQLQDSSLLPYLEFYYYQERIDESDPQEVLDFTSRYAKEPFANTLKINLFQNREKRENYQFILDHAQFADTLSLRCYLYNAQQKNATFNFAEFQKDWEKQLQLPNSCLPAERYWLQNNNDLQLVENKIETLLLAGRVAKAESLIASLPEEKRGYFQYFVDLLKDPSSIMVQKRYYPDSQALYNRVLQKWSSQDSLRAEAGLQLAKEKSLLTDADYIKLRNRIAVFQAGRADAVAPLEKILAIPVDERDDQLIQWGFRLAAKEGNYSIALALLSHLSPEAQKEDIWRYWLGRTYMEIGDHEQAKYYYKLIQNQPSFYGFLAADALEHNYDGINAIAKNKKIKSDTPLPQRFIVGLLLAKANEEYFSRVKWQEALRNSTQAEQEAGSIAAFDAGFYNLSLQAATRARAEGGIYYRYPVAYLPIIEKYSDQLVTEPIVLGLIRQESLFHERAKSPASAYGLMQLLIPTAERVSLSLNEKERESLYDPEANIRYGITYLHQLKENVGSCIPYMLASYNAGPHNVKKWLPEPGNEVDMILWIETIPFYETRGYVKNVLSNAVIYHALNQDPKRLSEYLNCSTTESQQENPIAPSSLAEKERS
ncbi:lytic transglycosylase domain-containing protein [Ignatzschineria cameli]|uniref:lytic transglycosylase domain-containing protein n=1 Tax=Ignatzschineria cameli TaxID=2182793 RepID=UPI000D607935|nr:lytic transglycosylase domain-containing protein [Ignatzschineria cameli]PWD86078.1 hypothetical protein DC080_04815 [Ignatzschineria cameli]